MKKVALNISKDVKKFWIKIEKLVSHICNLVYEGFVLHYNFDTYLFSIKYHVILGVVQASVRA